MPRILNCIIGLSLFCGQMSWAQEELPYWRQNSSLYDKVLNQRKIVVSADTEAKDGKNKVKMMGVGVVHVPIYYALEEVMKFEDLPEVSDYFKKVTHNKEKKEVYYFIQALGKQVRLLKTYKWGVRESQKAQLDWLVTWGTIKGMSGHFAFRKVGPAKTEISFFASLEKPDLPLPAFLLNFTLEVITEKTAQKMRSYMEERYNQSTNYGKTNG